VPSAVTPQASVLLSGQIAKVANPIYGLDFSPYIGTQDPDYGAQVNESQIRDRLSIIAPYTLWIRTYGSQGGLEKIGSIAHEMDLKVVAGAWLSKDLAANDKEIDALIVQAKAGNIDMVIVGSETLYRGDLAEDQLIDYIERVRQSVPDVQVTTSDTYGELKANPRVIEACNVVMFNYYPYFEGISIDDAIPAMNGAYKDMSDMSVGKPVLISETGWPSAGEVKSKAVPSPENASEYFTGFVAWADSNQVSYFYFDAFDEAWKVKNEGAIGAHWGIWDKDGNLKPGMDIFNGQ
jgi:exo-beta-1,3-glucanase (GH17 family)